MNPAIIPAGIFVLISIIGLAKKHREIFLTGYMLYGILVFVVEFGGYMGGGEKYQLFVAFMWLCQAIMCIPKKAPYDSPSVREARIKILACLSLINITGFLEPGISPAPEITFWYHVILSILPLIVIYLLSIGKIVMEK
ncbi:MAG: hypothetical protein CMC79_02415 [Flavobacteriaceae bacterium]|nr:hypothetical protein [Flavobacteriaceae bacterium]|tara:strand:- start:2370 stop:2786 length:417 start_codon:yes stop_codon:yes gene_type:complete